MLTFQIASINNFNAHMTRILWRQQQELLKKSPDGIIPFINNEDPLDIQADIEGPKGTPYENGIFRVKFYIPVDFPQIAPKGYFLTKIYHPNVSEKGEICVNTLKKDWDPKHWSLYNLLEVIKCLLIIPFPESSLNEEAGKIFMENYGEYCTIARIYTNVHAIKQQIKKDNDVMDIDDTNCHKEIENDNNSLFSIVRSKTLHFEVNRVNNGYTNSRASPELGIIEEKPTMTRLPFLRSNSLQMPIENIFGNSYSHGSSSGLCFSSVGSFNSADMIQQKRTYKEEIKKWLLRI